MKIQAVGKTSVAKLSIDINIHAQTFTVRKKFIKVSKFGSFRDGLYVRIPSGSLCVALQLIVEREPVNLVRLIYAKQ